MKSRLFLHIGQSFIVVFLLLTFFSCKDSEGLKPKTIADLISENEDFTILRAALRHAGYSDELRTENLTFFAPNDQAFISAGIADASAVTAIKSDSLRTILQYYLLPKKYTVEELATAGSAGVTTVAKTNLFFKKKNESVFVNGSKIVTGNIKADNGTVHIIDKPFTAPTGNLLAVIKANSQYSLLAVAIEELLINEELKQILTADTASFTFFAPTNAAFVQFGLATESAIKLTNKTALKNIIFYHIIRDRVFTSDLVPGSVTSISRLPITVVLTPEIGLLGRANELQYAHLIQKDLMATNGLLHGIDRVLKP